MRRPFPLAAALLFLFGFCLRKIKTLVNNKGWLEKGRLEIQGARPTLPQWLTPPPGHTPQSTR